ncbi:MAG: TonB-dependent receptor [Proteobacteria bacterium]|nr:TonB-dependent receptor [Pseudomonadota bacterium]
MTVRQGGTIMILSPRPSFLIAAALALCLAPAVQAASDESSGQLQEIIVTAQKREQSAQDVGISLSALSGSELRQLGASAATDITRTMPAVVLTQPNGPSSFSLSIRGVTQNDFADHQESPAAVYVDDVYVSQMAGLAFQMFDIDRVEVLRGPQGTLFGRNATGGLAQFVSRRPTEDLNGYADVTFGEHNLTRIEGAVGGGLFDGVSGRIAFESNHYDPLVKNLTGGPGLENGNDWALRGQLLFKFNSSARLLLIGRAGQEDVRAGAWESTVSRPDPNVPGSSIFLPVNENFWNTCPGCDALGYRSSGPFAVKDNFSGFARLRTRGLTGEYTQDLGFAQLTAIADYQKLTKNYAEDSDTDPVLYFQFFNGSNVSQSSGEVRLNGDHGGLHWVGGLYALRIDGDYYEGWNGPFFWSSTAYPGGWPFGNGPAADGSYPQTQEPYSLLTRSGAAFAQVEDRLTDLIGVTLGARYTIDKKDYTYQWYPQIVTPQDPAQSAIPQQPVPGTTPFTSYTGSIDNHLWSGKAQLDFHLSRDLLAYVSYNRGVKGGGFNAPLFPTTVPDVAALRIKPEVLTSYEGGFKSMFWERRARLNGAVYYYDYHDYQALTFAPIAGAASPTQLIRNANARNVGGELEFEVTPIEALRLGVGIAYVDAVVRNIDARGIGVPGDFTPGNAPRWSGNAMARYTWPLGTGHLAAQIDGNYLSKFWFNIADTPTVEQGGYGLGNLRLIYTSAGDKFEIGASLENVADKHYAVMAFDNTGVNGVIQTYPGNPRWTKVHIAYHF